MAVSHWVQPWEGCFSFHLAPEWCLHSLPQG